YEEGDEKDVSILGLVRQGKRLPGFASGTVIRKDDFLVLEGDPKSIEAFIGSTKLSLSTDEKAGLTDKGMALVEAIVPEGARAAGRTADNMRLRYRQGVELLGVSRQGKRFQERVGKLVIEAGDVLLLLGPKDHVDDAAEWLGVLPLAERSHDVIQRRKAFLAIGIFVLLIAAAALGFVALSIALSIAVAAYALLNIVGPRDIYQSIEWPVIVLLGSLIPLGAAFEDAGGTQLITGAIIGQTEGLPVWVILAVVMAVTMILSDFLNSIVTVLIA